MKQIDKIDISSYKMPRIALDYEDYRRGNFLVKYGGGNIPKVPTLQHLTKYDTGMWTATRVIIHFSTPARILGMK